MRSTTKLIVLVGALGLLGACRGTGNLSIDSRLSDESTLAVNASTLELGGGALVIDSVQISVSETEFEGGKSEMNELEAELGAAVIDVAVDGSATVVTADSVDAGSYHTFGMELSPGLNGSSIEVSGTWNGAAFTYGSGLLFEAEFPIDPPVEVPNGGSATMAVTFDVAAWFTAADGSVIDPTDPANQSAIDTNIESSIAATAEIEGPDSGDDD